MNDEGCSKLSFIIHPCLWPTAPSSPWIAGSPRAPISANSWRRNGSIWSAPTGMRSCQVPYPVTTNALNMWISGKRLIDRIIALCRDVAKGRPEDSHVWLRRLCEEYS